jgi:apolipoprotein N-acyltransferase
MLIGYSQFKFTKIIQIAEFTGVYGVSFLIIFCNLCFYFWISARRDKSKNANSYLYLILTLVIGISIFGFVRVNKFSSFGSQEFSVAIVQPNIDQYKKWNKFYESDILLNYERYAFEISKINADLVVWPETALVGVIPSDEYSYDRAKHMVSTAGGFNIVGSLYNDEDNRIFNVVLTFENGGDCKVLHRKTHLVPFGEFVPFKALLSRFFGVLSQTGDTTKGEDIEIFSSGEMRIGSTICSENFFPDISRKFALMGAKVFTNHTNDAWFFDTAAPHQHFVMNVFRAVETRKSFIISANSGISGIIEASGLVVERTLSAEKALLTGKFFQNDFKTFYTKYGDLFVGLCAGLFLVLLLLRFRIRIREV